MVAAGYACIINKKMPHHAAFFYCRDAHFGRLCFVKKKVHYGAALSTIDIMPESVAPENTTVIASPIFIKCASTKV